jgi:uncharacterized protein (UPF0332 family)
MIEPHELMALAERLAVIPGEPERRAAVSRAYYSAFHEARLLIQEGCGIVLPGGMEIHRKLIFCLEHSQNPTLIETGDQLSSLREERNRADYNLADPRFASTGNIQSQLVVAKDIVEGLKTAEGQLASIRPIVREYARTVLKLRLTSP